MQPDCTGLIQPDIVQPDVVAQDPGVPAGWAILVLLLLITAFEVWALARHKNTISHLLQRLSRGRRWFRWLAALGFGILVWHLLWGFPW